MLNLPSRTILITGARGYVGSKLVDSLIRQTHHKLRCLVRQTKGSEHWPDEVDVVVGDLADTGTLSQAIKGVDTAYYLIHSMAAKGDFVEKDRLIATQFSQAAKRAGVKRIVYLGGLGSDETLSTHLASRQEVGRLLRESGIPTVEFRASVIIGPGSLSYELIRALVRRLPIMVIPKWVQMAAQPIAVDDVISYLQAALYLPEGKSEVYEIGGPDRLSYLDLMREYAQQRGWRRWFLKVPFLSLSLSSLWLNLVTPVYARIGRKLINSVRHATVVNDTSALRDFPIEPMAVKKAVSHAIDQEPVLVIYAVQQIEVTRSAEIAFEPIVRIGGKQGWYYANWLWQLRGWLDRLIGGMGMRQGRRDPYQIAVGDQIDFWRVDAYEPHRRLVLSAEMKLPGNAWLEFEVQKRGKKSVITQRAYFEPKGWMGLCYWYGLYPLHYIIFRGMLRGIVKEALSCQRASEKKII